MPTNPPPPPSVYEIAVLPGDGIGVEVMDAALPVLERLQSRFGFTLRTRRWPAGAIHYRDTGEALPEPTFEAARDAHAILFGAMGWPEVRYPDGTEIAPQLDLRFELGLYAGVRPVRTIPALAPALPPPFPAGPCAPFHAGIPRRSGPQTKARAPWLPFGPPRFPI